MNINENIKKEYLNGRFRDQLKYRMFINYRLWPLIIERFIGISMKDAISYNNINKNERNYGSYNLKYKEMIFESKYDKIEEDIKNKIIGVDEIIDPLSMHRSIHLAVINDDAYMVEKLVKLGANLNVRDLYGQTPLLKACSLGYIEVVKTLIELGAPLAQTEYLNQKGMNCYEKSKYYGNKLLTEYLDTVPKNINIEKQQYWNNKPLITRYNLELLYHRKLY